MRNETERPPAASSEEFSNLASAVLAARLPAASPWMPRREMEELARRGPAVLPVLADVLRMAPGRGDPVWPIVVLGELRDAGAVPVLGVFLGRVEGGLNVAAAEALGKIGAPALPYLVATTASDDRARRLAAYGALAMVPADEAQRCLRDALGRDRVLGDVIARALVQQGQPEAIAALAAAAVPAPRRARRRPAAPVAGPRAGDVGAAARPPRPLDQRRHRRRLDRARRLRRGGDAHRATRRLRAAARPRRGGAGHAFLAGHHSLRGSPCRTAKTPPHRQRSALTL